MASAESIPPTSSDHVKAAINDFAVGFNHSYYQPFCSAILKGDWKSTRDFLDNDPSALTAKVAVLGRTALHVAAVRAQWEIVMKLVQEMPEDMLTELDLMGRSCLHYVAMGKSIDAAKALVAKNPCVTQVADFKGSTPLIYAISSRGCKEMIWYLVSNTTDERPSCPFSGPSASQLVALLTTTGFHDITLHLLQRYPILATISDSNGSIILNILSKLPKHFQSGHNLDLLGRFIYPCISVELENSTPNQSSFGSIMLFPLQIINLALLREPCVKVINDIKNRHVSAVRLVELIFSTASTMNDYKFLQSFVSPEIICSATSSGIVEILKTCFQFFPDLVWTHIPNEGNVVQIAIKNRQESVFRLLCKMPIICKLLVSELDESQNTTSHLAAKFSSQVESISGAAFQMQKELQWFKIVEKMDDSLHKEVINKDGKTPWQLFKKEHKPLLEEAKVWIKDRSNSGMVVATLIATITFAAAITVPGGINQQDKGKPIFLSDKTFTVFVVSDALAFFCSMASLMMFLSAINGRYTERDFIQALPIRLVLGSNFLLLAVVAATLAFNAALSMLVEKLKVFIMTFSSLAFIPFILMARFQFPELKGIEGNEFLVKNRKFWLIKLTTRSIKLYKKITSR